MKTCLYIAILLALVAAGSVSAAQVTKVDLLYGESGTVARIEVQGPFQFTHKVEGPKDGRPDRLYVDVLGATHTWGPKQWSTLPPCGVKVVRIGQFSSKPDQIVRVVFELNKAPIYRVESDGKSIKLHFTDNTVKQFAAWTTGQAPSAPPVIVPATPAAVTNPTPQTPVPALASTAPKPVAPSVVATAKPEVKMAQPVVKPAPNHADMAKAPAVNPPTAGKPVVKPVSPIAMTQAEKPAAAAPQQAGEKKAVVTTSKPIPANQPPTKPATAAAPQRTAPAVPPPTAPALAATDARKAPVPVQPSKEVVTAATPVSQPASQPKSEAAKPVVKVTVPAVPTPLIAQPPAASTTPSVTSPAPALAGNAKPEPAVAASADKPVSTPAAPAAPPANEPVLADAGTPTDGSASGSARPTARFRRTASSKMKSSLVAEFPQRLVVKYESMGYRDPFATLIDDSRTYDEPLVQRVPNVDGLKLVGVLESPGGDNRALFEDKHNFSYILKSGDKVQKGYVLRVEDDRVYFQIFEYGWSRTIALTLENRN